MDHNVQTTAALGSAEMPVSDHWCPGGAASGVFSSRATAQRLLGVPYLQKKGLTGAGVNVVIIDQGLDADELGSSYGGGWPVPPVMPGTTKHKPDNTHRSHAMMVAHNIREVAPDVTFYDVPLVPEKISDIPKFVARAVTVFTLMLNDIAAGHVNGKKRSPRWILVNPWGIFDRSSEKPKGSYTNNPRNPLNLLIEGATKNGIDVVFAAGNCGQFCPNLQCAPNDTGPGSSIFGAACLGSVLTVGAVRADAMWLGYSSQGPGQPGFWPSGFNKPDLCVPSQFSDSDDASSFNTGTSAACGLAAGVVAALRSNPKWGSGKVSSQKLVELLNHTARTKKGAAWNDRTGNGILDAKAAYEKLAAQYP